MSFSSYLCSKQLKKLVVTESRIIPKSLRIRDKLRLVLFYQNSYSIASNLMKPKKAAHINLPDGLAILVPFALAKPLEEKRLPAQRGYCWGKRSATANEIAVKLPNQYILDLPEDLDIQRWEAR
jgi:hypothetical protein